MLYKPQRFSSLGHTGHGVCVARTGWGRMPVALCRHRLQTNRPWLVSPNEITPWASQPAFPLHQECFILLFSFDHICQIPILSDTSLRLGQTTTAKTISVYLERSPGFPGGAVVENLPANAGDTGSSPGLGRSHMLQSNWAREPQLLSLRVWSLCSATREAAIVRGPRTAMKSGPRSPQLEKALAQKRRPNTAKK